MVSDVAGKLEVRPAVLGEQGKEGVKLCLSKIDNMGGGFFSKLFKIELGSSTKGFDSGCGSEWGQGADDVGVGIDGSGLKGVWVNKSDAGTGRRCGILGGLRVVDIVWAGAHGFEKGEAGGSVAAAPVAGASWSRAASAGPVNISGWAEPWVLVFTKPRLSQPVKCWLSPASPSSAQSFHEPLWKSKSSTQSHQCSHAHPPIFYLCLVVIPA